MGYPMNKNKIVIDGDVTYIHLNGDTDQIAMIDTEDLDKLEERTWYLSGYKNNYAVAGKSYRCMETGKRRWITLYLHRVIIGEENIPEGMTVDHISRDEMDCRKANLRVCTIGENSRNRSKLPNTITKYKGVQRSGKDRFRATITCNNKLYSLGCYSTDKLAAVAYDLKAIELHGEYAVTNFPRSNYE